MIVIFEDAQHVVETRTGDKHNAFPVMNHAIRAMKFAAGFEFAALLECHAALGQVRVTPFSRRFRESIDP